MANLLQVENHTALTTFSFLTDTTLITDTVTHTPVGNGKFVTSFQFLTDSADIQGTIDDVEDYLRLAVEYHNNPARSFSWWFVEQLATESAKKRALIYDYYLQRRPSNAFKYDLTDSQSWFEIGITRGGWEDFTATTTSTTSISCQGGVWDLTGTSGGRLDGRIAELRVEPTAIGDIFDAVWIGIKPVVDTNTMATFDPVIDFGADYGTPLGADTTDTGAELTTTFATDATMAIRAYSSFAGWGGGGHATADFVGRYLVLLRMKYSDQTTSCGVEMRTKGSASDHETRYTTQYPPADVLYSDHWRLVPLGEMQFGPDKYTSDYKADADWDDFRLQIYAERNKGSGNLLFSHVILIPAEHMVATDQNMDIGLTWLEYLYIRTNEDGSGDMTVTVQSNSNRVSSPEPEFVNWVYPRKGGKLVFAGHQYAVDHDSTDTVDLAIDIRKRWGWYRE